MSATPEPDPRIARAIPHRPPFLLLDRVEAVEPDEEGRPARIVAETLLREEDELLRRVYAGHYPGNPITPGVLLCEMVFQAGAVLLAERLGAESAAGTPVLVRIRDARFREMVRPGATVRVECAFEDRVANAFYLKGSASAGGRAAVRVSFTCALVEETA